MKKLSGPFPLDSGHSLDRFDCGVDSLDSWLRRHARAADAAGSARTYVVTDGDPARVVGYHALTVASIVREKATKRIRKGMPRHPIPAVLLARLAVDLDFQGRGVGALLLGDALKRALSVAETAGIRLLLVHALNESARGFYERFGFEPSPTDPMNLQLLIKDIRESLDAAG